MSSPFDAPPERRPAGSPLAATLQIFNAALFGALALGAGLIKASVYVVAFLAVVAFAYALDAAARLRKH